MKVVTIVGARPQFIKAAVVSRTFLESNRVEEIIVHTGQHFDQNMSDVFFDEMVIPKPTYNLAINGLNHGAMTGQMLEKIEEILIQERPDWVLVYGDTNSTLAGALAARKLNIKLAHVEAGLRSFNMKMPEEVNRILTDRISNLLFCPTDHAKANLINEGYESIECDVVVCGDVMQDAASFYLERAQRPSLDIPQEFVLATIHRAENTDDYSKLKSIFGAFSKIAETTNVVIPIHPRTRQKLEEINFDFVSCRIIFVPPIGYLEMVWLLKNCLFVMTDSGGLQKEAYFFKKFCLTLREETEWVELVDGGYNVLVGSDYEKIIENFKLLMDKQTTLDFSERLYGAGNAGAQILNKLLGINTLLKDGN